jgi:COP9 signalosome complex subunit 1
MKLTICSISVVNVALEAGTDESKIIVNDPTLDLEAYARSYTERTRELRLVFIAEHCPPLRIEALR